MTTSWTPDGIAATLAIPESCNCCDPCSPWGNFCPSISDLCVDLQGLGLIAPGHDINGVYSVPRVVPGFGPSCGRVFQGGFTSAGGLNFSITVTTGQGAPGTTVPPGTARIMSVLIQWNGTASSLAFGPIAIPGNVYNCTSFGSFVNNYNSHSPLPAYAVSGTETATVSTPPCPGSASAGPLSAPAWRTLAPQRLTFCTSLGQRLEHLPGCISGFGCKHECNSFDPNVIAHLGGIMTATPSVDCQDCPGYSPRLDPA